MAFVDFEPLAIQELRKITQQGACEFGLKTANRIIDEVERIGKRLEKHPKSGFPETLLEGRTHEYRSCTIRKRFKMVYYYDEPTDTVHVMDFWDMRMSPTRLKKRMK